MAREDYYSLLGVDRHAPEREIKRAYYGLARDLHPDKAKSPEEARQNSERLGVISKAYNTLKDPNKREAYDASQGGPPSAAAPGGKVAADPQTDSGARNGPAPQKPAQAPPAIQAPSRLSPTDMQNQRILTAQKAFVKGMEFFKAQEFKKALPFFEAAVNNDPESEPHYHMKYAICLMKSRGSFTRAVAAAEEACRMDGYNMDFKLTLGDVYETAGVSSKAREVYEDILRWDPENEKAKLKLAINKASTQEQNASFLAKMLPTIFGKK